MYEIEVHSDASETDKKFIRDGIVASNYKVLGHSDFIEKPLTLILRDKHQQHIHGGILAWFDSESVYIDVIWVDENSRNQGYGTKLLSVAEKEAAKLGCRYSTLDTFSFQAENFLFKKWL